MDTKILITGRLPENVVSPLQKKYLIEMNNYDRPMDRQALIARVQDKMGLLPMINDCINEEVLVAAPHLKMIANFGVGYNNIDIHAATKRGIMVTNTPGVLTEATAELAFALLLSVSRRIVEGDKMVREGRFKFWAPMLFLGTEVMGKTLGIIGMGKIGKAVTRRARAFDMKILYHNRKRIDPEEENDLQAKYADLKTLLAQSDFISVHVPLTEETRHLIGGNELSLLKPSSFLINTSRGPVIDEKALVEVLKTNKIAGAGLDVYENEPTLTPGLTELDTVILLPHIGSGTLETRTKIGSLAVENMLIGLAGGIPPNLVNPDVLPKLNQKY
jgi:glyoxylate reductase